ncbi:MAG TPA: GDSL-type esterase/lipase family protein, partial [Solirubrobacteraceae bacterium]|nr:GDSL-type esterase/lipase family protein [Solirubrobacteraceae bacterium]
GSTAYWDTPSGEAISGCHRSKAAQAHIGGGVLSANLACSGARTSTGGTGSGEDFKPGIDFYTDAQGRKGQALALQEYASTHNVKAVVVMIGANNYGFADIVTRCVTNWVTSPSWWKNYCSDDSDITSRFTATRQATETANVRAALQRVAQAMTNAGYTAAQYTILAQTYWSPLPRGAQIRYSESGWSRQNIGGCGVWNRDANWANDTVVVAMNSTTKNAAATSGLANVKVLDLQQSLDGRRLCENTVGLLEEKGIASWTSPGAVDNTEWVSQVRTVTAIFPPYQIQEGSHASYWGEKAMRNCLRQAYNGGNVRGGVCVRSANGLNGQGEPNMALQ